MTKPSPFKYFKTSPEIIRLAVMKYIRFPLSLRHVGSAARAWRPLIDSSFPKLKEPMVTYERAPG